MKRKPGWLWMLTVVLTMGASMSACAVLGVGGTNWKEEVLLHDGNKIIVERTMDRGGRHEIGQKPPIKEQSLTFVLPSANERVMWTAEYSKEVGYADLRPLLLGIVDGIPYLVTDPVGCLAYNKWKRPNPPYIFWRYENKAWRQIDLADVPAEIKVPNLIISSPDTNVELAKKTYMTSADIAKLNGELPQPQYRAIVREALPGNPGDCTRMIRVKSGWEGLGFFRSRGTREACLKYCQDQTVAQHECPCNELFEGK